MTDERIAELRSYVADLMHFGDAVSADAVTEVLDALVESRKRVAELEAVIAARVAKECEHPDNVLVDGLLNKACSKTTRKIKK